MIYKLCYFDHDTRVGLGYPAPMCAAFVKKWLEMIARSDNVDPRYLSTSEVTNAQEAYDRLLKRGGSKEEFWGLIPGYDVNWTGKKTSTPNHVVKAIASLNVDQGVVIRIVHSGPKGQHLGREMHAMVVYRHRGLGMLFFNPGDALYQVLNSAGQRLAGGEIWYGISNRYEILYDHGVFLTEVTKR